MIRTKSRFYPFSIFGDEVNAYGEPILSAPKGFVKMAIYQTSQSAADNIKYSNCEFMGLSIDKSINDSYVISYNDKKLKVKYVNPQGRYNQVFMTEML